MSVPRSGNWNANTELLHGANHPVCSNPHLEYIQKWIRVYNENRCSLKRSAYEEKKDVGVLPKGGATAEQKRPENPTEDNT
jgi:antirestriction protein ArdC